MLTGATCLYKTLIDQLNMKREHSSLGMNLQLSEYKSIALWLRYAVSCVMGQKTLAESRNI